MRICIAVLSIAIAALVALSCTRQAAQPSPRDNLVNVLTSAPGSVHLSPSDKVRLARYVLDRIQSLTNTPGKP